MLPVIVLASESKTRQNILHKIRIDFKTVPSNLEEDMNRIQGETFQDVAKRIAILKTRHVAALQKNALVIGADTFGVINNTILSKPYSNEKAIQDLLKISKTPATFYTAMVVIDTARQKETTEVITAKVTFRNVTRQEITEYVEKEDVTHAAGSFKTDELGSTLVEKVEGDYYAIIGLSPSMLAKQFITLGYNLFDFVQKTTFPSLKLNVPPSSW